MIVDAVFSTLASEQLQVHLNTYGEIVFKIGDDCVTLRPQDAAKIAKELHGLSIKSAKRSLSLCEKYNARS